ncbi:restriction endonuclease subunit S [Escherichia coli]|jgi:type I restriction enzyme S subunit|uniref:restriction endonuclease subunit S n=1 Tax=Escherichia TaxID=561 RepID=UPI00050A535C|nr:restriction endonuclease subunit S [Escherichia coli]EEW1846567.1 restriction endonuclease subunit S [Escherichia coli]EFB1505736.1 restriction endonuclease subunit S [Escherichia coli]EFH0456696.1 restriction endonuclease subunit S [Escherichia coli]EHM0669925.1 restriction endonuclease subunit S [Escherichia coli]EHM8462942.1 restriction endonuclease subunit S [Escherichia coli]
MSFNFPLGQTIYPVCPILDGADFISGYAFKSNDFIDSGHPVIKIKNIQSGKVTIADSQYVSTETVRKLDKFKLSDRDVLIAMTGQGSVGRVGRLSCEDGTTPYLNQRVGKFVADEEKLNIDYLYYVLSTKQYQEILFLAGSGSGQPNLSPATIKSVEIPFAPYEVQCRISSILNAIDEKISLNEKTNQTLEQMAQALFKSWFVDFEPVKAKVAVMEAGGSQEDATLAAMTAISGKNADALVAFEREHPEQYAELKATAELFPAAMQDSELGAIPKGWGVASISEMGKVTCGKTPSKKEPEYYGSDVPFIKIPDMHGQLFVLKTNEYLSEAGSKSQLKKLVPANSICVSCIATIGVVSITNEPSHTNQQINSVTPHKSSLLYYLYFCMLGLKDHLHILGSAGSATLNVNTSTFSGIKIAQPDAKVLELFHAKCTHLFNEIKSLSVQTESLTQLRDTLLPKLLSGEITLPEAEQAVSEVENV